jgi:hypothetical protein
LRENPIETAPVEQPRQRVLLDPLLQPPDRRTRLRELGLKLGDAARCCA